MTGSPFDNSGYLQFDGTDSWVLMDHLSFELADYTVSLWFRLESGVTDERSLFSAVDSADGHGILLSINRSGAGTLRYVHRSPTSQTGVPNEEINSPAAGALYNDGQWHHLAVVRESDTSRLLYVDGVEAASTTIAMPAFGTPLRVLLGTVRPSWVARVWSGGMDDLRIYERALTQDEIQLVMTGRETDPRFASAPSPGSGQTDVLRASLLSWTPGESAATHDVYLGTVLSDVETATKANDLGVLVSSGQAAANYHPLLQFGQTYYWRVDEVSAPSEGGTVSKGNVWSFTVEPYSYPITPAAATASSTMGDKMGPANTINSSGLDPATDQHSIEITTMWVSSKAGPQPTWIQYEFDRVLKLDQMWVWNSNQALEDLLGYGVKQAKVEVSTDGTTWTEVPNVPEFAQATGQSDYVHNTTVDLGGAVAQYVKLTCLSTWGGGEICSLSEVRFFQVPTRARAPQPESGAANVDVDTLLTWRPGRQAARHEVYLGTDPNALVLAQTVTDHQVTLTDLGGRYGQTYYWQVNEVNDAALPQSWEGDVWTLSTPTYKVVDDFESYNDQCSRVYYAWKGGAGNSENADCGQSAYGGNGTGSIVGNDNPPYAERTNVHSGAQAMPFSYDNTSGSGVSEAALTFSPAQDWTLGGIQTLVLFFKGDPANGSGQVYLKINGTKVSYSGSTAALTTGLWNQWNVDLSGLSVKAVSSLTIGVSGTGKGDLYVDDIRLYGQAPAVAVPTDPGTGALASYYAFEADAKDAAGKGYNGTLMNEPTFGDSKAGLGKALALDGVNDYVDLPIG
ncbi:MAG: discoidin domain-containing protein, partial [Phycisphaerae bacterium]|nr:discoidin domain-containing protein [Phycisphaerae bacterium]